jgi:protein-S-isoprenylcysteine O-methyltransferase Ste14
MMFYLLLFYLLFFGVAMALPTIRVWKSTGINPLVIPKRDDAEGFVGRAFKLLIGGLGLYLMVGAAARTEGLARLTLPGWVSVIGCLLLGVSLIWVVIAQFQMGRSWRVGIDTENRTELIRHGLFRLSRNPIFLGMVVQLASLFLLQPDAVIMTILTTGFVLISVQVRLEEAHLERLHGSDYAAFKAATRRWL